LTLGVAEHPYGRWGWFSHTQRPNPLNYYYLFYFALWPLGIVLPFPIFFSPLLSPWEWLNHLHGTTLEGHGGGSVTSLLLFFIFYFLFFILIYKVFNTLFFIYFFKFSIILLTFKVFYFYNRN